MIFQVLLAITILASSACGLIIEIVAGRLLAPVFGMSLYTWTSIIAVVLAGLSVGHWVGGNLTRGHFIKRAQLIKNDWIAAQLEIHGMTGNLGINPH